MNEIASLFPTLLKGLIAFIATNIDDLLLLILFLSLDGDKSKRRDILIGQYLGFIVIIALSMVGSLSRFILPLAWIGLLGLVPIATGLRKVQGRQMLTAMDTSSSILTITFLTLGDGMDNMSTYTPLFASETALHICALIVVFLIFLAIWYYVASALARIAMVIALGRRMNQVFPYVLILLGILIMNESGTLALLARLTHIGSRSSQLFPSVFIIVGFLALLLLLRLVLMPWIERYRGQRVPAGLRARQHQDAEVHD